MTDNVNSIGKAAFYGCSMLQNLILSRNVATIGSSAFYGVTQSQIKAYENSSAATACANAGINATIIPEAPAPTFTYGDLNDDGDIDSIDVLLLRRLAAGWTETGADALAADVNGDGDIDSIDVLLLRRYAAGWNVTLGPQG
jgi:hypothetical protein